MIAITREKIANAIIKCKSGIFILPPKSIGVLSKLIKRPIISAIKENAAPNACLPHQLSSQYITYHLPKIRRTITIDKPPIITARIPEGIIFIHA